jgi:hypothetical protein
MRLASEVGSCSRSPSFSPLTLASNLVFNRQIGNAHCRQISTKLMFSNVLAAHVAPALLQTWPSDRPSINDLQQLPARPLLFDR